MMTFVAPILPNIVTNVQLAVWIVKPGRIRVVFLTENSQPIGIMQFRTTELLCFV